MVPRSDSNTPESVTQFQKHSLHCDEAGYLLLYLHNYRKQNGTSIDKDRLSKLSYELVSDGAFLKLKVI